MVRVTFHPGENEIHIIAGLTMKYDGRMKKAKRLCLIAGIVLLIPVIVLSIMKVMAGAVFCAAISAFAFLMAFSGVKSIFERTMYKFDTTSLDREYMIDETGIAVDSELGSIRYGWDKFIGWGNVKNYIYVLASSYQVILLDRNLLGSDEIEELEGILARNVRFII